MWSILIFFLAALIGAEIYRRNTRSYKLVKNIKGPPQLPLVGSAYLFMNKTPSEILSMLSEYLSESGQYAKFWMGFQLCIMSRNVKDVEAILSSQQLITKSLEYGFLKNWLGDGLLISTGRKWFGRRKIITPTFHFKILEQFVDTFDKQSNTFVDVLKKYKPTDEVDIYPLVTLCALDVICESAMGTTTNAQIKTDSDYVRAVKDISNILHLRMFSVILRSNFFFRFSMSAIKERKALKVLHDFTDRVIISRREELMASKMKSDVNQNGSSYQSNGEDIGIKKKMALLDVLLQATIDGKPLTNSDIREEVDTFMFEGHDTTTSGISFTLYNIAKYPEVQKKVFEEIRTVIGDDKTRPVTLSDLNELHYLDLVIKESLRLFPPVPMYSRQTTEDTKINDLVIPANTSVIIGAFFMGRDPELFPNPEEFIPERFDVVKTADKQNPFAYIPFSAGPRNCIGQKFAMLEMKSLISKVLRHFEITTSEGYDGPILIAEIILKPENGILLNFKPRVY